MEAEQRKDHVFHRHVARPFPKTRDGRVRDGCARLQGRERVGDAEAEVLMAVDSTGFLRRSITFGTTTEIASGVNHAKGVGNRQGIHVPFGGDLRNNVEEPVELGAGGVDGEEHGVEAGFLRGERRVDGRFHRAVERPAIGVLDHVVAGGNLDHDAFDAARLDDLDFFRNAAGEREDLGLEPSAAMSEIAALSCSETAGMPASMR